MQEFLNHVDFKSFRLVLKKTVTDHTVNIFSVLGGNFILISTEYRDWENSFYDTSFKRIFVNGKASIAWS